MKNYIVQMQVMEKPSIIGIRLFLIDSEYLGIEPDQKIAEVYYIGFLDRLEEAVLASKNIMEVIENEISQFKINFKDALLELKRLGTKAQLKEIVLTVEAFIRQSILKRFE